MFIFQLALVNEEVPLAPLEYSRSRLTNAMQIKIDIRLRAQETQFTTNVLVWHLSLLLDSMIEIQNILMFDSLAHRWHDLEISASFQARRKETLSSRKTSRGDDYFIEAFPFRNHSDEQSPPHVIAYRLGSAQVSAITMFLNPFSDNAESKDWEQVNLAQLRFPVGMTYADVTGNGFNDVIIIDEYGPSMDDLWMDGGRIIWLQNSGNSKTGNWRQRFIGKSPGMHRVKAGHFTTRDRIQVAGFPIIIRAGDRNSPAPVVIFTAPESPEDDDQVWAKEVAPFIFQKAAICEHIYAVLKSVDGGLDKILIAGREGITLIWYNEVVKTWMSKNIGSGGPQSPGNPYWGSGCVALGKIGLDTSGFIGTIEAFHGTRVAVYVKDKNDHPGEIANAKWTRHVLHEFGDLNARHEGYLHHVICADIDGDGDDELLVACMESNPPSLERTGFWCYKSVDIRAGKFSKFKLTDESAARIAVANFRSSNLLVPGHFESPSPSVILHASSLIAVSRLNDEIELVERHLDV
ncbi:hypothetical protein EV360DRAFT_67729 [Lentinula raphanica]|nr:hypothetical protein EV360DRAFT_67729 [Lentinula raphanica]